MKKYKHNDHRSINKYINIFHINKQSPGMIFWNSNGLIIIKKIKKLIRIKLKKYKYKEVQTAFLINKKMWIKSGHWKNYKKSIFTISDNNKSLCIKPMNCLGHIELYKLKNKSYKELPIRFAEFGICHRNEPSGSLQGLMRTRSFIQDDAHIFCTKKQIKKEIINCINLIKEIYSIFKFKNININISTRPKKFIGNKINWIKSENKLIKILNENKIKFKIKYGDGAFYGPKIEFILKDNLNRKWQCGTIQLDFNLSNKFNLSFKNKKNYNKKPIIIHRAILGSLERFIAILIEQNNGWLPIWLTPIQIVILNISKKHIKYSIKIFKKLNKYNFIRIKSDFRNKKINFKIREYTLQKIPYMIVCGDKEKFLNKINVRFTKKNKFKQIHINKIIKIIKHKTKKIFKGDNY